MSKDSRQSQDRIRRTRPGGPASSASNTSNNSVAKNNVRASLPAAFPKMKTPASFATHKKQQTPIEQALKGLIQSHMWKQYLEGKVKSDFKKKFEGLNSANFGGSAQVSHRMDNLENNERDEDAPETPREGPPKKMESSGIPRVMSDDERAPEEGEIQVCNQSTPSKSKSGKRRTKNVRNAAKLVGKAAVAAKKMKAPKKKADTGESPVRVSVPSLLQKQPSIPAKNFKHTRSTAVVLTDQPEELVKNLQNSMKGSAGGEPNFSQNSGEESIIGIKSEAALAVPLVTAGRSLQMRYTMGNRKESVKSGQSSGNQQIFEPAPNRPLSSTNLIKNKSISSSPHASFDDSPQQSSPQETLNPSSQMSSGKKKRKINRAKKQKESVDRLHYGLKDRIKVLLLDPTKVPTKPTEKTPEKTAAKTPTKSSATKKHKPNKTMDSQTLIQTIAEGDVHPPSDEEEEDIRSLTFTNIALGETEVSLSGAMDLWQITSNPPCEADYIEMAESLNHSQRTIIEVEPAEADSTPEVEHEEGEPEVEPPTIEVTLTSPVFFILEAELASEEVFYLETELPVLTIQLVELAAEEDYVEFLNFEESLIKVANEQSPNVSLNLHFLQQFEQSHWQHGPPPTFEIFSVPEVYKTFLSYLSVSVEAGNLAGLMRLPLCPSVCKLAFASKGWKNLILQWADCLDFGELKLNYERGKLISTLNSSPAAPHGENAWAMCEGALIKTLRPDLGEAKVTLEDPEDPSLSLVLPKSKPTMSKDTSSKKNGKLGSISFDRSTWKRDQTKNMLLHQILNSPVTSLCYEFSATEFSCTVLMENKPKTIPPTRDSISGIGRMILKSGTTTRVVEGQISQGQLAGFGRVLKWTDAKQLELQLGFWTTPAKTPVLKVNPQSMGVPFGKWEWVRVTKAISMQICEKGLYAVKPPKKKEEGGVDLVEVEKVYYDDYILNAEPTAQQVQKACKKGSGFLCCAPPVKLMKYEIF